MSKQAAGSAQLWGILKEKIEVLAEMRQTEEAIRLAQRLVVVACRAFGPEHPAVGESYELLGDLFAAAGRIEESEPPYLKAYEVVAASEPKDLQSILRIGSALADAYEQLGMEENAARIYAYILSLDEDHPLSDRHIVANLHNSYAIVLNHLNQDDKAEEHYRRSLELYVSLEGEESPFVALLHDHLGAFYLSRQRVGEALESYQRSLAIRRKLPDVDAESLAQACSNLAVAHHSAANWAEADEFYREALDLILPDGAEPLTADAAATLRNYSALLRTVGRKRDAAAIEKGLSNVNIRE